MVWEQKSTLVFIGLPERGLQLEDLQLDLFDFFQNFDPAPVDEMLENLSGRVDHHKARQNPEPEPLRRVEVLPSQNEKRGGEPDGEQPKSTDAPFFAAKSPLILLQRRFNFLAVGSQIFGLRHARQ
ncbi:MAG: hypothetical protein ABR865_11570 [Terracidiphilus sp.]